MIILNAGICRYIALKLSPASMRKKIASCSNEKIYSVDLAMVTLKHYCHNVAVVLDFVSEFRQLLSLSHVSTCCLVYWLHCHSDGINLCWICVFDFTWCYLTVLCLTWQNVSTT